MIDAVAIAPYFQVDNNQSCESGRVVRMMRKLDAIEHNVRPECGRTTVDVDRLAKRLDKIKFDWTTKALI